MLWGNTPQRVVTGEFITNGAESRSTRVSIHPVVSAALSSIGFPPRDGAAIRPGTSGPDPPPRVIATFDVLPGSSR